MNLNIFKTDLVVMLIYYVANAAKFTYKIY
jgi:hypothetical protein